MMLVNVPAPTTMYSQDKKISKPKKNMMVKVPAPTTMYSQEDALEKLPISLCFKLTGCSQKRDKITLTEKETKSRRQKKRQNHADKKETKFYYSIIQFVDCKETDLSSMLANGMISTNLCSRKALALEEEV